MTPAIQARLDRVDALKELDYESAITLGQEFLNVITTAFTTQMAILTATENKITEAKAAKNNRVIVQKSILDNDLEAIAKGKQTCEYWKASCIAISNKFQEFIIFMKEFHGKEKTQDFIEKLTILYPVFKEFTGIFNAFKDAKNKADNALQSDLTASLVYQQKASQSPVNEQIYTQAIADCIAKHEIFKALTPAMLDMCSFDELTRKS